MAAATEFLCDPGERPKIGDIVWLTADDGVRLRAAVWPEGEFGTVLILPGRTEYVEKYGPTARRLAERGYATASIDWRGQGLSDRLAKDRHTGHVADFLDFQKDLDALIALVKDRQELPKPFFLLAHSMGGAIGLRALLREIPVMAAAFTGPLWGLQLPPLQRPFAKGLADAARGLGLGALPVPAGSRRSYVAEEPFEDNQLTTDADEFAMMKRHIAAHPELELGPPSFAWLATALREVRAFAEVSLPNIPTLVGVGTRERIVDPVAIRAVTDRWPSAAFMLLDGSEHEILMEKPAIRHAFLEATLTLYEDARVANLPGT
ncbi:MAG: alpha/beta hydrolase [Pseudomonadota bacterium]